MDPCSQEFWQFYKAQEGENRLMAFSKAGSESYCSPGIPVTVTLTSTSGTV